MLSLATRLLAPFSAFKTKFEVLRSGHYHSPLHLYDSMSKFEGGLDYLEKLKYRKAAPLLEKKIKKLFRKQAPGQDLHFLDRGFATSTSYELFYEVENQQYRPLTSQGSIQHIPTEQLYGLAVQGKSRFHQDADAAALQLLSNPPNNPDLLNSVRSRCSYFEDQLAINAFQGYEEVLREADEAKSAPKAGTLRALRDSKKEEKTFTKEFKFMIKEGLSPQQNYQLSEVGKVLIKYGFGGDKVRLFSLKSLSNEAYKSLSPPSLKNHLFTLAYFREGVAGLADNLFRVHDLLCVGEGEWQEHRGEMGPLNSLLFYMLSNKVENYELYRAILRKLGEGHARQGSKEGKHIDRFDRELFRIMLKLVKLKYELTLPESAAEGLERVSSNSGTDFERFLRKRDYKWEKSELDITREPLYRIEDRAFLCLDLPRIDPRTEKVNGVGEMLLECFKAAGEQVKMINPLVLGKCGKLVEKEEYFRSKLKGVQEPSSHRNRRFDF